MTRSIVTTDGAPAAIGPYAQGVRVGNLVFTAGQIPLDPVTGQVVPGGIAEQTKRVLENLKADPRRGRQQPRPRRQGHRLPQGSRTIFPP